MPTVITRTVGASGADYTTIADALAARPASLVAADEQWDIVLLPGAYTSTGTTANVAGTTTDATRFTRIRCATGASFREHPSVATNPHFVNSAYGVLITQTGLDATKPTVVIDEPHSRIEGVQISATSGSSDGINSPPAFRLGGSAQMLHCLVEGYNSVRVGNTAGIISYSTIIKRRLNGVVVDSNSTQASTLNNVTLVVPSGITGVNGIKRNYNTWTLRNCVVMVPGVVNSGNGGSLVATNCLTNQASPPSGFTTTALSTSTGIQFESLSDDFRVKSGSSALNAGATYSGQQTSDVLGQSLRSPPSSGSIEPPASGDTTAPTLTSPTGASTGSTTASGTVSTNEANGTLYRLASTNSTESVATVKAAALTQAVTATGSQSVTFTGLTASTTYYAHYVHADAAGNDSAISSSASFTTGAAGDSTAPTLTSPTGTATSSTAATGTVSTDEANGTLYFVTTVNATETGTTVKAGTSQAVTATGVQNVTRTGLTASTTYRHHYLHRDASGNDSAVVSSATFTTDAPPAPTITTHPSSQTVTTPTAATFTASASGTGLSYQWQRNPGGNTSFANISAATSASYTTGATAVTGGSHNSGDTYRAVVTNASGSVNSNAATLTVNAIAGTLTLTAPLCNNTGLLSGRWVSQTGVRLSVVNESTGATVLVVTGRATDATGVLTAAVTDAAIVTGQTYRIIPSFGGNAGLSQVLTAT